MTFRRRTAAAGQAPRRSRTAAAGVFDVGHRSILAAPVDAGAILREIAECLTLVFGGVEELDLISPDAVEHLLALSIAQMVATRGPDGAAVFMSSRPPRRRSRSPRPYPFGLDPVRSQNRQLLDPLQCAQHVESTKTARQEQ
ncbi:sugar/nucleoside kinase (ribokinase family) [Microbacterium sp. SORGH_AS 1204]|uniref:hypothetical protein n=1 Tax=Microbacterium sp. SORGH_AS_1204 TaxID=3041785 RepID=UPI00279241D6|nr:hypothetical protein [Microbacterium sp. SORGH_AS_1204]MDQ1138180.1 sugar/nucleoside kinase (ribokinase family) [Microbacterium sp. SORGH_AS_1204]